MENKSDEQFIIIKAAIEDNKQDMKAAIEANKQEMKSNKQDSDEKMTQFTVKIKTIFSVLSNQINTISSSPTQKDTLTTPEPITVVPTNKRGPPLEGGHSTKIGGMWTLKHEIRS